MNDIIIKIEEVLTHQGEDIARMSEELYTQQKELAALRGQVTKLTDKIKSLQEEGNIRPVDEETPPPHY